MNYKMNEDVWMSYIEGDEVRWSATEKFKIIKSVDEYNKKYVVDIDGTEHILTEDELS